MFESLAFSILNNLLGQWVKPESFSSSSVETSLALGNVKLSDLELRQDALDWLLLPIKLSKGFIGRVELSVPWTSALSDQAKVSLDIEKVLLVLESKTDWTLEERERRAQMHKISRLAQAELVKRSREAVLGLGRISGNDMDTTNLSARLAARLLAKLEVRIRNVHIHFETRAGLTWSSAGLLLDAFKVVSAEDQDALEANDTCKVCTLSGLSVYLNPAAAASHQPHQPHQPHRVDQDADLHALDFHLATMPKQPLLQHVDASLRVTTKASGDVFLALDCTNLDLAMDAAQYATMAQFSLQEPPQRLMKTHRPRASALVDPRSWWKFAVAAVLRDVRARRFRWTRPFFAKRRRDRIEYMGLWLKRLASSGGGGLSAAESNRLDWLERQASFEDICLFRSWAEKDMYMQRASRELEEARAREQHEHHADGEEDAPPLVQRAVQGWFGWAFPASSSSSSSSSNKKQGLSEAEIQRLMALLKQNAQGLKRPLDVTHTMSVSVAKGSLAWYTRFPADKLGDVGFEGLRARVVRGEGGHVDVHVQLDRFALQDPSQTDMFRFVCAPREPGLLPLLAVSYAAAGPDAVARLTVRLQSLELVHSPEFFSRVGAFFHAQSPAASEANVRAALGRRRAALSVDFETKSPVLILPAENRALVLVVDLGRVSLRDHALLDEAQVWAAPMADDAFDEYQVVCSRIKAVTMDILQLPEWRSGECQRRNGHRLVDHLSLVLIVSRNVLAQDAARPQFKIRASLPSLVHCRLSAAGLDELQRVVGGGGPKLTAQGPAPAAPSMDAQSPFAADAADSATATAAGGSEDVLEKLASAAVASASKPNEDSDSDSYVAASRNEDFYSLADEFERSVSRRSLAFGGTHPGDDESSFCTATSGGALWRNKPQPDQVLLSVEVDVEALQVDVICALARPPPLAAAARTVGSQHTLAGPHFATPPAAARRKRRTSPIAREPTPRPNELPRTVETWLAELDVMKTPGTDRARARSSSSHARHLLDEVLAGWDDEDEDDDLEEQNGSGGEQEEQDERAGTPPLHSSRFAPAIAVRAAVAGPRTNPPAPCAMGR
jgi:hypothetical protein